MVQLQLDYQYITTQYYTVPYVLTLQVSQDMSIITIAWQNMKIICQLRITVLQPFVYYCMSVYLTFIKILKDKICQRVFTNQPTFFLLLQFWFNFFIQSMFQVILVNLQRFLKIKYRVIVRKSKSVLGARNQL